MCKIYVASHSRELALSCADLLAHNGHEVVSRWIQEEFLKTEEYSEPERQRIAKMDFDDVMACDCLLLLAGPDKYSGGKFVEAGIALGARKRVCVIGRRENMLLWLPEVRQYDTLPEFLRAAS